MWRVFESAVVRKLAYVLVALIVSFVWKHAHAATTTTWFRSTALPSPGLQSPDAAVAAVAAYCQSTNMALCSGAVCSGPQSSSCTLNSESWTYTTWPTISVTWNYTTLSGPHTATDSSFGTTSATNNASCPVAGSKEDVFTQWAATGSVCGADGCLYTASNPSFRVNSPPGTHYLTSMLSAGQICSSSQSTTPTDTGGGAAPNPSVQPAPACQAGSTGVIGCDAQGPAGAGCGEFNGDYVCVQGIGAGQCVSFASGGVACTSSAAPEPTGPAPNNGTPGVAPTASGQVTYNTTTVNYYSASVVAGSSTAPTTTGATNGGYATGTGSTGGGSGSTGDGKGNAGTECGNGTTKSGTDCTSDGVSGGSTCTSPPVCTGDAVQCDQDFQSWHTRCATEGESDLVAAIGSTTPASGTTVDATGLISTSGPVSGDAGVCPAAPTVSINGRTLTLDWFTHLCEFAGYISVVVLALGYLVAGRVFITGL